ncbi:FAD-dependent oxidoreductase [Lacticaseibacillus daqingensis]|uniref:FAD-dependent oxidoreductase n=1 Tax=Lacticaseibacillus daqingensis TaxID=2486014 RepID=UPI0013DE6869|nr:FAD-dependent oxidoreductase [Lacticaseibacillus daqingensis]
MVIKQVSVNCEAKQADLVVVGGGLSGLISALTAAKQGIETVLVQNRSVLGGNSSSEIRINVAGADHHGERQNARETGLIETLLLRNKWVNPANSFHVYDTVLWAAAETTEHLQLYLNTHIDAVSVADGRILSVSGTQQTSERRFEFSAPLYVDATGDGTIGALAGATYMMGREAQTTFHESLAPTQASGDADGSTLMYAAKKLQHPVQFERPIWAHKYSEAVLAARDHSAIESGYWWLEAGGDSQLETVHDAEAIRDELMRSLFGVWDHIKNGGNHGADNYALDWVQSLPGRRESRRLVGQYILTENDIMSNRQFDDAVAFGGWPLDQHVAGGLANPKPPTATFELPPDLYQIPYRCLFSQNIDNLFLGGRAISVSDVAFGSTRVMGTCSVVGQAVGLAASLTHRYRCQPAQLLAHIDELQQLALREDLYLPGVRNHDPQDVARTADVQSSEALSDWPAIQVINGIARPVGDQTNGWRAPADQPQTLTLSLRRCIAIEEVIIRFDSALSMQIMPSLAANMLEGQDEKVQHTLVKDFAVELLLDGQVVATQSVRDNYLRDRRVRFDQQESCDTIRITCLATNGAETFCIFEVRAYEARVNREKESL